MTTGATFDLAGALGDSTDFAMFGRHYRQNTVCFAVIGSPDNDSFGSVCTGHLNIPSY